MSVPLRVLEGADRVVVIDWPSRDVPDTLLQAGFHVVVKSGPAPDDFVEYLLRGVRELGHEPEHADLVYAHRPIAELPGIVDLAVRLGAGAVWIQSGRTSTGGRDPKACWLAESDSQTARDLVESAGLTYLDDLYIADAVRSFGIRKKPTEG